MPNIIKTIPVKLDLQRVGAQAQALPILVEGDTGNVFEITMTDGGAPLDLSDASRVVCVFSKTSDGSTVEQDTEDALVTMEDIGIEITGTPVADDTAVVDQSDEDTVITVPGTLTATVDAAVFREAYPDNGQYVFTFGSAGWQLGDNSVIISGDDNNIITVALKAASYGAGTNNAEIQIYSGDNVLVTSANFNFRGRKGIMNDETIRSEQKYPILTQLLSTVQRLYNSVTRWIGVTASAQRTDGAAGVTLSEVDGHQHFAFDIPSDVAVGSATPTGQQSIWLKPDGVGYVLYYKENGTWTGVTTIKGTGISGAVLNPDYTLTLSFDDGTSYTTPSIRGAKGDLTSLVSTSYAYAVSNTASKPADTDFSPSASPVQGKYYWVRTTFTFDNGMTPSSYACAYVGADGNVVSVNGQTGVVVLDADDVGAVPDTREVNGHSLDADITLTASDVGAIPSSKLPSVISVTLLAAGWSSQEQTISNAGFETSGFCYIVAPAPSSISDWADSLVYADDVSVTGQMTFHCDSDPTSDISVNVLKVGV